MLLNWPRNKRKNKESVATELTAREKKLLACLLTLRAETANCGTNGVRWHNSERHKAEKQADRLIKKLVRGIHE